MRVRCAAATDRESERTAIPLGVTKIHLSILMNNLYKKILYHLSEKLRLGEIKRDVTAINWLVVDNYLQKYLYQNPKYQDSKGLNKHEYKIYSQTDEDGILEQIFNRIGIKDQTFVERELYRSKEIK
ncbi:MAG: hypothetical protein HW383_522 [Candidatus Magasanikbacteria bacterium]|nr:hypothetical protein [Candidatus Magasanikbacteria bacterium]